MPAVESVATLLWWLPYALLFFAAGCFVAGLGQARRAVWLWQHRDVPISDPVIAKAVASVKPPPYALYAAGWCSLGIGAAAAALLLSR